MTHDANSAHAAGLRILGHRPNGLLKWEWVGAVMLMMTMSFVINGGTDPTPFVHLCLLWMLIDQGKIPPAGITLQLRKLHVYLGWLLIWLVFGV